MSQSKDIKKVYRAYFKVKNAIRSCKGMDQLLVCFKLLVLFREYYDRAVPVVDIENNYYSAMRAGPDERRKHMVNALEGLWNVKYNEFFDLELKVTA